jgi:hypothetical protein
LFKKLNKSISAIEETLPAKSYPGNRLKNSKNKFFVISDFFYKIIVGGDFICPTKFAAKRRRGCP